MHRRWTLYCSREYAAAHGVPRNREDLRSTPSSAAAAASCGFIMRHGCASGPGGPGRDASRDFDRTVVGRSFGLRTRRVAVHSRRCRAGFGALSSPAHRIMAARCGCSSERVRHTPRVPWQSISSTRNCRSMSASWRRCAPRPRRPVLLAKLASPAPRSLLRRRPAQQPGRIEDRQRRHLRADRSGISVHPARPRHSLISQLLIIGHRRRAIRQ